MRRVGLLIGGGECLGINAIIKNFVIKCALHEIKVLGFNNGWEGVLNNEGFLFQPQQVEETQILANPLLTAMRCSLYAENNHYDAIKKVMATNNLEALAVIGGDDTLTIAEKLQRHGINVVGIPKTIDNDLSGTDFSFGFYTATNVAAEAMDRLHSTALRTGMCFVLEVMGNDTGWIAVQAGIAAGAHMVLIPEFPKTLEEIITLVQTRHSHKSSYTIICVAEGFELIGIETNRQELEKDVYGNIKMYKKKIGSMLAQLIEKETGITTRTTVLGHLIRGGTPTAADRTLGAKFGVAAAELIIEKDYGYMVGQQGSSIVHVSLAEAIKKKYVDEALYHAAGYHSISN